LKPLNSPVVLSLFGLIIGIALADYVNYAFYSAFAVLSGVLCILIVVYIIAKRKLGFSWLFSLFTLFFFCCLGYVLHKRILPENTAFHYTQIDQERTNTVFLEIKEVLKPSTYQDKYISQVLRLGDQPTKGLLLLNTNKDSILSNQLQVGSRYYIHQAIQPVPVPRNPYQFDYGAYLKPKQIHGQLSVSFKELLVSESKGKGVRVWASRFRESLQDKLQSYAFTTDQLAIINALVLGQRQGIDRELSAQYAAAGMMHILAVSGLHVGIILLLLRFITRPIGAYKLRFLRSGLIIILIWSFAILTGLSPSVLRAATMFSFLEASSLLGSKKESANALVISAFVLLLIDPLLLYQVGFQLSYLAVLAILWIQPWLSSLLIIKNKFLNLLWNTATLSTAAQLGVLPLSLFYFHQFPGLFLVSNIVVIPLLGVLLGAGVLVVVLAGLHLLPEGLVTSFGFVIDVLNSFIWWVASKEDFVVQHISLSLLMMIALYFLIISGIAFLKKRNYRRLLVALGAILFFLSSLSLEKLTLHNGQLIIFHKSRQTLVGTLTTTQLHLQTDDSLWNANEDSRIQSLRDNRKIKDLQTDALKNIISFNNQTLLIIDSLGIYTLNEVKPDYILLTQSPNINLERLIERYPKTSIIADGNNYKSDVDRWKATCRKQKIPFHSTYEKGAFSIE